MQFQSPRADSSELLHLTPHESVTVRERGPDRLVVEAIYAPGGSPPPAHFHPDQDERFEVTAGRLSVRLAGKERVLGPGDVLDVPRGVSHRMWNSCGEPARAVWITEPAGRTHDWFVVLDGLRRQGRVRRDGMPGPLAFGVYLTAYRDVFRLAGPQWLLRGALALLAVLGRLRGYEAPRTADSLDRKHI
jgi:mannose-6-phosphate isomerase-like protein (cupin superfamily)